MQTRDAYIEDRHRRRIDDPQPAPLARSEERGPLVAPTLAIDEEAGGRAVDIGDVGRVHPHRAPRKTVLQRLILAGEQPGERLALPAEMAGIDLEFAKNRLGRHQTGRA